MQNNIFFLISTDTLIQYLDGCPIVKSQIHYLLISRYCGLLSIFLRAGVFEVADYESDVRFSKFKMVAAKVLLFKNIHENFYYGLFRVANYESEVKFSKFKMPDS